MERTSERVPVSDGLFTWPAEAPQLIGSKCRTCGEVAFPKQAGCPRCGGASEPLLLGRRGVLWTWTIQHFPPPSPPFTGNPETFRPFGVGYVELPEGVRVESRLTTADPRRLRIGMPMQLAFVGLDEVGRQDRFTYAFAPAGDE